MQFRADMHIHSVLSPCGDIEMSPSAIVAQAKAKSTRCFPPAGTSR